MRKILVVEDEYAIRDLISICDRISSTFINQLFHIIWKTLI